MANSPHLLVPIKAQALVIDDIVIDRRGAAVIDGKYVANDGRWSPLESDYSSVPGSLSAPGPVPFYGATRKYQGKEADQLVLDANSRALPKIEDRGVYLHWVLPPGLRHAYKPGSLDFPALPDQWLIARFCRRGAALQTNAWFVDSGLVVESGEDPANLLFENGDEYEARRVGKVVSLDEYAPADFEGERTVITAIGNPRTGSPTFTAFLAENRNVLSWHDDLNDLREPDNKGKVPKDTSLSYLLLGWYRDAQNEPLKALPVRLTKQEPPKPAGWLVEPLGWLIESASQQPDGLIDHRCVFHGMIAHINYWSSNTYKGPMLGYPGSPAVAGTLGDSEPSFKVGVGNNAEDALVSLVSSEYSGAKKAPNLWKALEAVIYRQPESLVGSWNAAPRDHAVHQSWFSTLEAGKTWSIRPRPGTESTFPADAGVTAAQTAAKPTSKQLTALKQLNKVQSEADAASRDLAALQQDLYARWWKLCEQARLDEAARLKAEEADCRALVTRVAMLRTQRDGLLDQLRPLPEALKNELPEELELRCDDAPRFWAPADPVIVVKNCGRSNKHQFPHPLPCRLPEQVVSFGEVTVGKSQKKTFDAASGVTEITAAVRKHFSPRSEILTSLLNEGSLVEQAIFDLAIGTYQALPPDNRVFDGKGWRKWTKQLVDDLTWDGQTNNLPADGIGFGKQGALNVRAHRLAELWVQQPWAPLFLDWQITWFPTTQSGPDFGPVWTLGEHDHDYQPGEKQSPPTKGFTVRGRSLLSPIDGRIFDEPLKTLRELLKGGDREKGNGKPPFPAAVVEILKKYEIVWDETLCELAGAGLMGQALTGFHQALLRRDVTLPRVMPDEKRPWVFRSKLKDLESDVRKLLAAPDETPLAGERLAPPAAPPPTPPELPFSVIRAGAVRLDELWLVDDFGQWADLLGLTPSGSTSSGQVFHPRVRWHDDQSVVAMPPRIVQPARLNFRFTGADNALVESDSDPALSPICGWIFYNPLDQALLLCEKDGRLAGELFITKERDRFRIDWDGGARGAALAEVCNPTLKAFAQSLVETAPSSSPRLLDLLKLIDCALERIRPAAARRDALFGRPLALVSAYLGLELFGKAWTDPRQTPLGARLEGAGDAALNALRVRVNLGCSHNTEDGLVGYFSGGAYDRIVPAQLNHKIAPTGYIADSESAAVRVGFGAPEPLTLLMDPWGSVQAAAGLVPAKTITLAHAGLDRTLAQMEASFRIGPVLLQADRLALPTPAGDKGRWSFSGPLTGNSAAALSASDPRYFSDQPVVATEGRLLLRSTKE